MFLSVALVAVLSSLAANTTTYEVDPLLDGTLIGTSFGLLLLSESVVKPSLAGQATCKVSPFKDRCDANQLNALDREAVGRRSKHWLRLSDGAAGLAMLGPLTLTLLDNGLSNNTYRWQNSAEELLVMTESVALATLFAHILKFSIRRSRPTMYNPGGINRGVEHQMSFPSGHTTSTAAAATAYTMTYFWRHPNSSWRYVILASAIVLTGLTGLARVQGGMHFYSDIMAGALLGGAVGIIVPYLHRSDMSVQAFSTKDAQNGQRSLLHLSFSF